MTSNDDLRAQVARINPGDTVTVMVEDVGPACPLGPGEVWANVYGSLFVGSTRLRWADGTPGENITAVLSHEPAPKPRVTVEELDALPKGAVVEDLKTGRMRPKHENGGWGIDGQWSSTSLLAIYPDLTIVFYGALPKPEADQ